VGLVLQLGGTPVRRLERHIGVDLGISTFAALSDGGFIPA
jgi:hypothetical protein